MKLFSRCLLWTSILLLTGVSHAQKDAPVAGDVINLIQLIGKDYDAVSPTLRDEEIIRDRATIIAIFKSYMTPNELRNFNASYSDPDLLKLSSNVAKDYNLFMSATDYHEQVKNTAGRFANYNDAKTFHANELSAAIDSIESKRNAYYASKDSLDLKAIGKLNDVFNNDYVGYVADALHQKYKNLSDTLSDVHSFQALETSVQKSIPFIGGDLSFETVIEGLSKFLASRIKEELTTYVLDKVKEWLENPSPDSPLNELEILLPRTTAYLLNFNADQLLNFTNEIKQYIEEDLNNIFENLPNLRKVPRIARLLEMHPDMDFAFEALEMIPKLSKIKRPIEFLEIIEGGRNIARWSISDTPIKHNIANAMGLTCLIARSLTSMESGQLELVNLEDIDHYLDNEQFYYLYFGFLHQQNIKYYNVNLLLPMGREITVYNVDVAGDTSSTATCSTCPIALASLMEQLMNVVDSTKIRELANAKWQFESMLGQLGLRIDKVNSSALEIRKLNKKGEKVPIELATEFIGEIIDFTDQIAKSGDTLVNFLIAQIRAGDYQIDSVIISAHQKQPSYSLGFGPGNLVLENVDLYERIAPYIAAARSTNQIILDLHNKNYASALLNALEIASDMIPDNVLTDIEDAIEMVTKTKSDLGDDKLSFFANIKSASGKRNNPVQVDAISKLAESARKLNQFLFQLMIYYKGNYPEDSTFVQLVTDVRGILTQIGDGTSITTLDSADFQKFETLAKDVIFRNLVLSYYAGKAFDALSTRLQTEMETFKISVKDTAINLFSKPEAAAFKILFDQYGQLTFNWAIASKSDRKDIEDELEAQNKKLVTYLANYAFAFPSKLNLDASSKLYRLIHFVNDIAHSENPDDVEKAIEAFALPSGSFAIKRTARWNVSINSYPGIFAAYERAEISGTATPTYTPSISLTVPVGLSFSRGSAKCGSIGLFVPIIDVGALTRVYLDSDSSTLTMPDFSFKNILSPGVFVSYGLPKSPLSFNAGVQFGPELRKIEGGSEPTSYESWRFGLGITLDVPLLNLYTKPGITRL
ncbi:MAG: hypothetical protein ACI837_000492 [Crocinitomicaceae bacterium]|jgi:hypothetical protein